MTKFTNAVLVAILLLLVICGVGGTVFGVNVFSKINLLEHENRVLNERYKENNKELVLLQVITSKMPDVKIETQAQLAKTIYNLATIRKIPLHLLCGLIETESNWDHTVTSGANAKGLMQVLPSTAYPYLRSQNLNYDKNILYDPTVNVIVGISYLSDLQQGHIEAERTKEDDFTMALHSYFWGTSNTLQLYGKKDGRINVPNMSYPMRVIEASKKYKAMNL